MSHVKPEIVSWETFCPALTQYLARINYKQPTIIIRHFGGERLSKVLSTGTDRDNSSTVWAWAGDAWHAGQKEPLSPRNILYAWTIDLVRMARLRTSPVNLSYLHRMPQTAATALYDPEAICRDSEYEYHFLCSPRDALLGVLSPLPTDELVRVAEEHRAREKRASAAMKGTVERIVVPIVDMRDLFVPELEAKVEDFS